MPEGRGLFEVARERIRTRHLALRTEQAYLQWMRRYVKYHGRRHPRDMGPKEVEAFLTHLAVEAKVGASTQNQALQALLFLYRQVLGIELPWLENVTRASRPRKLPVVLSIAEVRSVLAQLDGVCGLIANLLYGSGLRQRKLGEPGVSLPTALARKYPNAAIGWGWQWVFPASSLCRDPYTGRPTRHHQQEKNRAAGGSNRCS